MKILFITHQLTLTGAPIALYDMARLLVNPNDIIEVISMDDGVLRDRYERLGINVTISEHFLNEWERWFSVFGNYDIVICNTLITFEAIHILKMMNKLVVWWIHEPENYFDLLKEVLPDFGKLPDNIHVVAVSPQVKKIISDRFSVQVPILPFYIEDIQKNTYDNNEENIISFLCIGSYSKMKGQDLLVDAICDLPKDVLSRCRFDFYGDKNISDEYVLGKLNSIKMDGYNISINDSLPHNELMSILSTADYLIVPSRMDSMSAVSGEAMMLGVPVLLSKNCGISEMLCGDEVVLLDISDMDKLCYAIISAVNNRQEEKYYLMCEKARKAYERIFSKDAFLRNLQGCLE